MLEIRRSIIYDVFWATVWSAQRLEREQRTSSIGELNVRSTTIEQKRSYLQATPYVFSVHPHRILLLPQLFSWRHFSYSGRGLPVP
jgi:hypothetical protein